MASTAQPGRPQDEIDDTAQEISEYITRKSAGITNPTFTLLLSVCFNLRERSSGEKRIELAVPLLIRNDTYQQAIGVVIEVTIQDDGSFYAHDWEMN